jgi:UDP-glucose 4-epimerase
MKPKVIITGRTGFIDSHAAVEFIQNGFGRCTFIGFS